MRWVEVPIVLLATVTASSARADEQQCRLEQTSESRGEQQCSLLDEVLFHFGSKPIRVVAQERDGDNPDRVCCKSD